MSKSISTKAQPKSKCPKRFQNTEVKIVHDYLFFACKFGDCDNCCGMFIRKKGPKAGELNRCACRHHSNAEQCKENARRKKRKKSA